MRDYEGDSPGLEITKRCFEKWKREHGGEVGAIDLIISASTHDDIHFPNPGNLIAQQENLLVPVFQLKTACTSAAYAIYLARSLLTSGLHQEVLILNGEPITRYMDYGDRRSCVLFGDGANVFTVSRAGGTFEILDMEVGGQGLEIVQANRVSDTSHLSVNEMTTGVLVPGKPWVNRRRNSDKKFQQDGKAVVDFVLTQIPGKVQSLLEKNRMRTQDLHYVVTHQSNLCMMNDLLERLGVPKTKSIYNIDRFGNTGAAGWATVLSEKKDDIQSGEIILASVFGAGMTWSNLLLRKV